MKLTAEIGMNNSHCMGCRCFGPRMTNMPKAVHQFSTVVDVIVADCNFYLGGVLQMTLQVTSNCASYFDDLKLFYFSESPSWLNLSAAILNPFQSEFGLLELDLSTMADTIREEASLEYKQEVDVEKKDASHFRVWLSSRASMDIQEATKFKGRKARLQCLKACSTYNYQAAWRRAPKAGTSARIFHQAAYEQWLQDSASSVLSFTGILGYWDLG
ncbi:uncharacterized protein Z519_06726 [Cladophialophora bantiana CBS 173.52]|uniref:Uncharacterized protein n=1 Tax=Cladophialophora bantiana (strain ATCC 10958 / CBS 173.52 / CDC B-1940 / NIH 8579) TaxID=1442370 RepID=A0A0D2G2D4_CLAB1|nr:uncharacterized protein Z519_06726 [Cladophialophora bantiana CBS 173.52]KIW92877.1 hypothetical protein Z519_06726 [Cladophialophora bantiana CBS 173.52]